MKTEINTYTFTGKCSAIYYDGSREAALTISRLLYNTQCEYTAETGALTMTRYRMDGKEMVLLASRIATPDAYIIITNPRDSRPCKISTRENFEANYELISSCVEIEKHPPLRKEGVSEN